MNLIFLNRLKLCFSSNMFYSPFFLIGKVSAYTRELLMHSLYIDLFLTNPRTVYFVLIENVEQKNANK